MRIRISTMKRYLFLIGTIIIMMFIYQLFTIHTRLIPGYEEFQQADEGIKVVTGMLMHVIHLSMICLIQKSRSTV